MSEEAQVDFAVVAYREDEQWLVGQLALRLAENLDTLVAAVRKQPSEGVALGICSYGDDFFLVVRPHGPDVRLLISDSSAAADWPVAQQALDHLGWSADLEPGGDDDDDGDGGERLRPAGDLGIVADLGVSSLMLSTICADLELYPDEVVSQIATHIGFGDQFEQAVDAELV